MKINLKEIYKNQNVKKLTIKFPKMNKTLIAKDIYLSIGLKMFDEILKSINADKYVLKGGTCLSKCFVETRRLSEDIDINIYSSSNNKAQKMIRRLSKEIDAICAQKNIEVTHRDKIWDHPRNFMHAEFKYDGIDFEIDVKSTIDNIPMNKILEINERKVYSILDKIDNYNCEDNLTFPCVNLEYMIAEKLIGFHKKYKLRNDFHAFRHLYDIYSIVSKGLIPNTIQTWGSISRIYSTIVNDIEQRFEITDKLIDNYCFDKSFTTNKNLRKDVISYLESECYESLNLDNIFNIFSEINIIVNSYHNRTYQGIIDSFNTYAIQE